MIRKVNGSRGHIEVHATESGKRRSRLPKYDGGAESAAVARREEPEGSRRTKVHRTKSGESMQEPRLLGDGVGYVEIVHRLIGQNPGSRGRSLDLWMMGWSTLVHRLIG